MATLHLGRDLFTVVNESTPLCFFNQLHINPQDVYIIKNGKLVDKEEEFKFGQHYHVYPRILGGKGGFGSMLRAIGAQIEKTTNREACRDLSGRRMRDVNHEKELRDWVSQKAEREREREERRQERREKRKQTLEGKHKHFFDDPDYHNQRMKVLEQLEEALQQGLHKASASSSAASASTSTKRKGSSTGDQPSAKKTCEWLGIDVNLSDLDSDSDTSMSETGEQTDSSAHTESQQQDNLQKKTTPGKENNETGKNGDGDRVESSEKKQEEKQPTLDVQNDKKPKETNDDTDQKPAEGKSNPGLLSTLAEIPAKSEQKVEEGPLDLEKIESTTELEGLGLERLKSALSSLGLKCGGTLEQRAERLWSIKGKNLDEIDPKLFAKAPRHKKK